MKRIFALGLAVLWGGSCQEDLAVPPPSPWSLLDGFGFRWQQRPHRVNKIGARVEGEEGRLTLEGGSWASGEEATDQADYQLDYSTLVSDPLKTYEGTSPVLTLKGTRTKAAQAQFKVFLDLETIGLSGCTKFAVLLRGFDFDTDVTHKDGYTVRGIGVRLHNVVVSEDSISFVAWMRLEAGAVPDRDQDLENYGSSGRVHYAVVGLTEGAVKDQTHGYVLSYPAGISPTQTHASASEQTVTIQGQPGYSLGAVGWTGFDFRLNPDADDFPGRYMREIQVRNYGFQYDAGSGQMKFQFDGYFSNSGPISWALVNDVQGYFVLIQCVGSGGHFSKTGEASAVETVFSVEDGP